MLVRTMTIVGIKSLAVGKVKWGHTHDIFLVDGADYELRDWTNVSGIVYAYTGMAMTPTR
jgi:hypothetical protein